MISGTIAAPRFRLDNRHLLTTHIHALVLEIVSQRGRQRLPARPDELMDLNSQGYLLHPDLAETWRVHLENHRMEVIEAVSQAFSAEIREFEWFDHPYIEQTVDRFVDHLDPAYGSLAARI